jgi:hypothetical protein
MDRERTRRAPGAPFGIAVGRDELRAVSGYGDDNDRDIYRFVPGHGCKGNRIGCSHAAVDGDTLFLSQAHRM